MIRSLVIYGDGINCERETGAALALAGFSVDIVHINDLIAKGVSQDALVGQYKVIALPGGFSFGDDLGSGKVLALKLKYKLGVNFAQYVQKGGQVIGICNGFQALIKMGVFGKNVSITHNRQGKFINQWIKVTPQNTKSTWLRGLGTIELPIRHGEGRVIFSKDRRVESLEKMEKHGMLCLKYEGDPNGSELNIAGLCDPTGRILGLMPHPEAFVRWTAHPEWTSVPGRASSPGPGLGLFQNAFQEAQKGAL